MHGDLERVMVEIEQMAKRVGNQLDAKAIRLEKLIDEADLKIAQLNRTTNDTPPHTDSPQPHAATERSEATGPTTPPLPSAELKSAHQSIYDLADAGLTPDQIAHELNQLPGQVELILNLRQS
ncbi:MAG: hypothetical protein AAF078_10510, partial [Planctomycetota bacterium]